MTMIDSEKLRKHIKELETQEPEVIIGDNAMLGTPKSVPEGTADYSFVEPHCMGTAVVYTTKKIILSQERDRRPGMSYEDILNEWVAVHWATKVEKQPKTADELEAWLRELTDDLKIGFDDDDGIYWCEVDYFLDGLWQKHSAPTKLTTLRMAKAAVQAAKRKDNNE